MALPAELRLAAARFIGELASLDPNLENRDVQKLIREIIFFGLEGGERLKWISERPHSLDARKLHDESSRRGMVFKGSKKGPWAVTYDHATPLEVLRPEIVRLSDKPTELLDFIDAHFVGAIITYDEAKRLQGTLKSAMPLGAAISDRMARYRAAGIEFHPDDVTRLREWRNPA